MSKNDTAIMGGAAAGFGLSPPQARAWQWDGAKGCRSQCALRIDRAVDPQALRDALDRLVDAHEILRTAFVRPTGLKVALQVIDAAPAPAFDVIDLAMLVPDAQRLALEQAYAQLLASDALLQLRWLAFGPACGVLLVGASALCADGVSVLRLAHDLLAGADVAAQDVVQYVDVADELAGVLEGAGAAEGSAWWSRHRALQGEGATVVGQGLFAARQLRRELELDASVLAAAPGGTEAFLFACWQLLLQRRQRNDDVRVAVAFAGRGDADLAGVVGPLARYLPMRAPAVSAPTLSSRALALAAQLADAQPWQEYYTGPMAIESLPTYLPVAFSLVHAPSLPHVRVLAHSAWEERFELKLGSVVHAGGLLSELAFDPRRHAAADMARLLEQYHVLVADALARPQVPVAQLRHVGEAERAWLLSAPVEDYARTLGVPALFEQAVQARPNAVALRWTGGELTFVDLEAQANRLANHLLSLGVVAESRVAVCLDRGPEWIVAVLGLLKAGAIYVPIDPEFHPQRIRHLLADAGCAVLLTDAAHEAVLGEATGTRVLLDRDADAIASCASTAPGVAIDADSLAYLIYTSGSTGTPKGVGVTHRNVHNYVRGVEQRLQLTDDAELLSLATIGADLGHTALLVALCTGRALRLLPSSLALDADALARTLEANPTDCLKIVPTHLRALLTVERPERVLPRQCLVLGGAALEPDLVARVRALAPHCRIVNHYGPTETTVGVSTHAVHDSEQPGVLPIGVALANSRFTVVDAGGELLGTGIPGELCIGGEGLARGYWNQPGLTAERFLPDPFAGNGSRLYRTGDLAVMRADGEVVYLGRIDHQVKIRGYRVELGEVESVLREHAAIDEAVVVLAPGEKLNAYLVAAANEKIDTDTIRNWLRERLPDYMVPGAWLFLKALPLNRNGKVDRKQLPEITSRAGGDRPYRAPRTEVERQLAGLWQQVLGLEQVGIDDNFFDLGGNSLLVTQVLSWTKKRTGVAVSLRTFFAEPTIQAIAAAIGDPGAASDAAAPPLVATTTAADAVVASPGQQRLWVTQQLEGASGTYNTPHIWDLRGALDHAALEQALAVVVARHDVLRTAYWQDDAGVVWQQVRADRSPVRIPVRDFTATPAGAAIEADAALLAHLRAESRQAFDLASGQPWSAVVLALAADRHVFVFNVHHIASDGWSLGLFQRELSLAHNAACRRKVAALPALPLRYADVAAWQRRMLDDGHWQSQKDYWRARLAGLVPPVLAARRPEPANDAPAAGSASFRVGPALLERLQQAAREEGMTLFMLIVAALNVLIARHSGSRDIAVGTSIAGRNRDEVNGLIGFFVNQLVLRTDLAGDPTVRALWQATRRTVLEAMDHQDVPFSTLVAELPHARGAARSPFFQVLVVLQDFPDEPLRLDGLAAATWVDREQAAKFDLTLYAGRDAHGLSATWIYDAKVFAPETVDTYSAQLVHLLEDMLARRDAPLSQVESEGAEARAAQERDRQHRKASKFGKLKAITGGGS